MRMGVQYLTLFAFSSENWKRPESEVSDLMGLLRHYLRSEIGRFHDGGVRLRVIGDRSRLSADIVTLIAAGEERTAGNKKLTLIIALNYGGRAEIAIAARRIAGDVAAGLLRAEEVDERLIASHLETDRDPRSGPAHSHQRRAADQQLPDMATRIHRAGLPRPAVAGLLAQGF